MQLTTFVAPFPRKIRAASLLSRAVEYSKKTKLEKTTA